MSDPIATFLRRVAEAAVEAADAIESAETDQKPSGDLPVEDVAAHFHRSPSTVRGWLIAGNLKGYKLNGRDWRVTRAAVREYEEAQREPDPEPEPVDISAWRSA